MRATIPYIESKFKEFNQQMFAGELPLIPIVLSDAKTFLGQCVSRKRKKADGSIEKYDFQLRINTRIDLPEQVVEDTIIHEMIHYFIGYHQLQDTSTHGQLFQHMMNSINQKYGRHLTIAHHGTAEQHEEAIDKKQHYHVVAVVRFHDGRIGIKVLPRVIEKIVYYYNAMTEHPEIAGVQLFMSNDNFFNRYPNSASLKVYYLDSDEIEKHLQDAERMECDGETIKRHC